MELIQSNRVLRSGIPGPGVCGSDVVAVVQKPGATNELNEKIVCVNVTPLLECTSSEL